MTPGQRGWIVLAALAVAAAALVGNVMVFGWIAALAVLTLAIWSLFNRPEWKWQAWVLVLAALAWCAVISTARGGDAPHPEHGPGHFYATWMQPDHPWVSCCSMEDCGPAQAKQDENGQWLARWRDDEPWVPIPPYKVETKRDMPDGRSHLCGKRDAFGFFRVYCFGVGVGG